MEKVSKALQAVRAVIKRFYYEHHDKIKMEQELEKEVKDARVRGFMQNKRRVVESIDYRIARLKESAEILKRDPKKLDLMLKDVESRAEELESVRIYVQGMVIKVEE